MDKEVVAVLRELERIISTMNIVSNFKQGYVSSHIANGDSDQIYKAINTLNNYTFDNRIASIIKDYETFEAFISTKRKNNSTKQPIAPFMFFLVAVIGTCAGMFIKSITLCIVFFFIGFIGVAISGIVHAVRGAINKDEEKYMDAIAESRGILAMNIANLADDIEREIKL